MGDDITIGVTEIVNNIEVTAQPNDQIVDISVIDNTDEVTLNITPTVIEINVNKGSSFAKWGDILGTLSDQEDLQDALDLKADLVDGKVPSSQLPSYVDDVIEVANYAALPATGESGKIYITIDNNHIFRWTGSIYVEITDNTAVWGAITGTLSSQTDLVTALNLRVPYTGATGDVNLGTYDIKSQKYWMLDEVNSNYGSMHFTDGNYHIEDADGHKLFVIEDGFMQLHKTDTIQSNLYTSNLTAVRDHYLPDASGTLALDENVVHKTGDETISGRKTFNSTTDIGIRSNISGNGYGIYSENSSNGISFYVANNGSGKAFSVSNTLGSFGNMYEGSYNGTSNFAVNYLGEITASKFIKSGGTTFEFLKANGDVDSNIYFKGSVTAGYLPKSLYPSSGDFTTSLIYDSGTNIGIGTTSPAEKLSVIGGNIQLGAGYKLQYSSTAYMTPENNVSGAEIATGGILTIKTGGTSERVRVDGSGNVGIGTTSPNGKLDVIGTIRLGDASYNSTLNQADIAKITSTFTDQSNVQFYGHTGGASNNLVMTIRGGGNVGIGTTSPSNLLSIGVANSTTGKGITIENTSGSVYGRFGVINPTVDNDTYIGSMSNNNFLIYSNATERMRITSGGRVGIGFTSPVAKLSVRGEDNTSSNFSLEAANSSGASLFYVRNDGATFVANLGTGLVYSNGGALTSTNPSDSRLKDNIVSLNYGLNEILQLRPVSYNWKDDKINQGKQFGFIAQEVQEVMPELVKEFETEEGERLGLDKEGIYAALVNAIKEQQKQIEELKKLINK